LKVHLRPEDLAGHDNLPPGGAWVATKTENAGGTDHYQVSVKIKAPQALAEAVTLMSILVEKQQTIRAILDHQEGRSQM
jgi:hypothetical protein